MMKFVAALTTSPPKLFFFFFTADAVKIEFAHSLTSKRFSQLHSCSASTVAFTETFEGAECLAGALKAAIEEGKERSKLTSTIQIIFVKDFTSSWSQTCFFEIEATVSSQLSGWLWMRISNPVKNQEDLKKTGEANRVHKDFWQVDIKNYYRFKLIDHRRQESIEVCHPRRKLPSVETVSKRLFFNEIVPKTMFTGVPVIDYIILAGL